MDSEADSNPEVLFRAAKRRRFQRRRHEDTGSQQGNRTSNDDNSSQSAQDKSDAIQTAEALRLRRLRRSRKGGIEFSTTSRPTADQTSQTSLTAPTEEDIESERTRAMCDRFTAYTGQTVDVDKHMMAYIESELAKRYQRNGPGDTPGSVPTAHSEDNYQQPTSDLPEREPASLGKLHEIDLGQEAKLRNIALTEEATRRINSGDSEPLAEPLPSDKSSRYRKRRTSEDIQRDRLVEEVLRESKLDVYDEPEDEKVAADDQAADDRVAEQFRRDFMDALQSRRRAARTKPTKQPGKVEAPKGPKLGGSRSARAAMREMQEKGPRK
ncbi:telomere length and silencing 1 family protein [Aspergillus stella-maris]|uniref:telomere length and silencing 1 family protein n=1 Tax=Aspergillus stella-maris TaxID=1810926 RepID=UPI003CCDFD9F